MILLNAVLVAFDFSETSTNALTYGQNLAGAFGGRLHVLHVADDTVPAHGSRTMPIWGPTFRSFDSSDKSVALRIANLVTYLESIQK